MTSPSIVAASAALALASGAALARPQGSQPDRGDPPAGARSTEVFFAFDSSELRAAAGPKLEQLAARAQEHPGSIVLEGHADPRGSAPYNVGLSARRAEAVRDRLVALGVSDERVVITMYGEDGAPRPTFAQERRVTATLTSDPLYEIVDQGLAQDATALTWSEPVSIAELEGPEHPAVAIR